jgi:type 1 fimbria pilin
MRISKFTLLVLIPVTALLIAACTGQTTSTQSTVSGQITEQTCSTQAGGTTTVDVDTLIRDKLQNHHAIDRIYTAHHTREEWNATLDRMIGYGAKISDSEKQTIIDYLGCRQQ